MNEAKQMHDDLLKALHSIVPRTTYQDIRRLDTLVWAVVGLSRTHMVWLGAWAEVLESGAKLAASRVRRFSRWLHHSAIHPYEWYSPLFQAAINHWSTNTPLYVALDTTALTPFLLIRASLIYRGCAIPLAWRVVHRKTGGTQVRFEDYQPVLEGVHLILIGRKIILLADRGFGHAQLISYLQELEWGFRLRLKSNVLVSLKGRYSSPVKALCPPVGEKWFFCEASLFGAAISTPVNWRRPKRWNASSSS